ncbi:MULTISPECIES: hypothetical protein [unclassified Microbacterium]|uniref:hypothetical protein n=1 Tax=unclassified Microbacterium TaxID=2609290 RepID=UPI003139BB6C
MELSDSAAPDSAGIWNFSTFGPDLIVGALTALGVGLILIWAEQRVSAHARGEAVAQQQDRAVSNGVLLLQASLIYSGHGPESLLPAGGNLERLRLLAGSVSPDRPSRNVFGFNWLTDAVGTYERLQVLADSISARSESYESGDSFLTASTLYARINDMARAGVTHIPSWWEGGAPETLEPVATQVEQDWAFKDDVTSYLHARRLLDEYRDAFLEAWHELSAKAHVINLETITGAPHRWLKGRIVERRRRLKFEELTREVVATTENRLNMMRGGC